jgi:gamma-D-glutamyl-L-lysine dipeptidyl-peptidase
MKKLIPVTIAAALLIGGSVTTASANTGYTGEPANQNYSNTYSDYTNTYAPNGQGGSYYSSSTQHNTASRISQAPQSSPASVQPSKFTVAQHAPGQPVSAQPASAQPAPASSNASQADQIVNYALSLVGKAKYGHTNPSTLTFDCSGFTYYAFKKYGVDLHSLSPQGQAKDGVAVSKSQLQKGDLVFFNNSRKPLDHVGIYIGNNKIVHAANSRSNITVSDLSGSWYQQNYVMARHVL